MSVQEISALEEWIAINVMGWRRITNAEYFGITVKNEDFSEPFYDNLSDGWHALDSVDRMADYEGECDCGQSSTGFSPAISERDALKVLEKCCEKTCPEIQRKIDGSGWVVTARTFGSANMAIAETLPLAISKFAKQLFSK